MAFSCRSISQAIVSKKVMLARAAEASRKTSPDEASWHSSGWQEGRKIASLKSAFTSVFSFGSYNSSGRKSGQELSHPRYRKGKCY